MRDYRQELADKLDLEVDRLHFEVRPGTPPQFELLVDGKDLTPEQEAVVVAFLGENPEAAKVPKKAKPSPKPLAQPRPRCQFCKTTSVDSARVGETLRYVPYCEEHRDRGLADAARILALITKPCSKCGAPAPWYHHKPECPRLIIRR